MNWPFPFIPSPPPSLCPSRPPVLSSLNFPFSHPSSHHSTDRAHLAALLAVRSSNGHKPSVDPAATRSHHPNTLVPQFTLTKISPDQNFYIYIDEIFNNFKFLINLDLN